MKVARRAAMWAGRVGVAEENAFTRQPVGVGRLAGVIRATTSPCSWSVMKMRMLGRFAMRLSF